MNKSDEQWKKELTKEQYHVLREEGTEHPYSGEYVKYDEKGIYTCVGCGNNLFSSENKFEAHCGWPAFDDVISGEGVKLEEDNSLMMHRVKVSCSKCGGHLGHVFPDGPKETTGMRYCINSVALNFRPDD